MAKSSIAEKLKALPRNRRNSTIMDGMDSTQRKLFDEWIDTVLATQLRDRPSYEVLAKAMTEDLNYPISKNTLAKYLNEKRRS